MTEWAKYAPKARPLEAGEKYTVFLSYRSVNRPWVLNLYDVLRQHGHEVFLDQCVIVGGDSLINTLQKGLQASQAAVLIWSSATADSKWVEREYEVIEAMGDEKPSFRFVPVRLDDAPLPLFAKRRVFLDFHAYPDGPNGGELLRLLHAVVNEPLSPEAAHFADEQDQASARALAEIEAAVNNERPDKLVKLFDQGGLPWQSSATLGGKAAEGLTKLGADDDALAVLARLEAQFPKAIRPKQLHALALNRRARKTKALQDILDAQDIVGELYAANERDPETVGIYASTWFERYKHTNDARHLRRSRDLYLEAFETARDDFYTGINAAAKSVFMGELDAAAAAAARVQAIVGTDAAKGDYWATATAGEVMLMQKDYAEAARLYQAAVAKAPTETGSHSSTWRQACALMAKLEPSADERALIRRVFAHLPDCDQL